MRPKTEKEQTSKGSGVPFSSNMVRLSSREWIVVLIAIVLLFCLVPVLWLRIEPLKLGPDYRIPYSLGNDYWMYDCYCREVCAQNKALVIGDSVIWGHYMTSEQTLSHYLNAVTGGDQFVNMGVDGIHPAALAGLIKYYGRSISEKNIILHCNLLWMSSRKHDLRSEKEFSFNHPKLVPQFFPNIPCYRQTCSRRIANAVERYLPFCGWVNHLQIAYFDDMDIHNWTVENPYRCPVSEILWGPPIPDELPTPRPVAKPWTTKRMAKFNPAWVELETSFQWRSFKRTIEILEGRGNRVLVLVGPFNEHMLKQESLKTYSRMKGKVEAWLQKREIPYLIPPPLPSDYYADASHPLSEGYAMLAKQLFEDPSFVDFISQH